MERLQCCDASTQHAGALTLHTHRLCDAFNETRAVKRENSTSACSKSDSHPYAQAHRLARVYMYNKENYVHTPASLKRNTDRTHTSNTMTHTCNSNRQANTYTNTHTQMYRHAHTSLPDGYERSQPRKRTNDSSSLLATSIVVTVAAPGSSPTRRSLFLLKLSPHTHGLSMHCTAFSGQVEWAPTTRGWYKWCTHDQRARARAMHIKENKRAKPHTHIIFLNLGPNSRGRLTETMPGSTPPVMGPCPRKPPSVCTHVFGIDHIQISQGGTSNRKKRIRIQNLPITPWNIINGGGKRSRHPKL
jgi:hypothetical protein